MELIGEGKTRKVYKHDDYVLKIMKNSNSQTDQQENTTRKIFNGTFLNANVLEWNIFKIARNKSFSRFLCPCLDISITGDILKMKYAEKLDENDFKIPYGYIPKTLRFDSKRRFNWGVYKGQKVIIDYGGFINVKFLKEKGIVLKDNEIL